jgi:hypothetical protein
MLDNKLFDSADIKGDILINGEVQREFYIERLFYLHSNPILPFLGSIYEAIRYSKHDMSETVLDKHIE